MIREFKQPIYPYILWVAITDNPIELNDLFEDKDGSDLDFRYLKQETYETITRQARCKKTKKVGAIILFNPEYKMSYSLVTHEAYHAAERFYRHIEENIDGEPFAYLIGWIADCCDKMEKHYFEKKQL
jgi:hypothetical protein